MYNITKQIDNKNVYVKIQFIDNKKIITVLKTNVDIKDAINTLYLDYFNNFLSVENFCKYYQIEDFEFYELKKDYNANFN